MSVIARRGVHPRKRSTWYSALSALFDPRLPAIGAVTTSRPHKLRYVALPKRVSRVLSRGYDRLPATIVESKDEKGVGGPIGLPVFDPADRLGAHGGYVLTSFFSSPIMLHGHPRVEVEDRGQVITEH